jgi:hypothetical protein
LLLPCLDVKEEHEQKENMEKNFMPLLILQYLRRNYLLAVSSPL